MRPMAKKRKNRPRQRPRSRLRKRQRERTRPQKSSPDRMRGKPSKEVQDTVDHGRRRLLIFGLVTAVAAAVGVIVSREEEATEDRAPAPARPKESGYQGPPKDLFNRPKLEDEMHKYEKWASAIELPHFELGESLDWEYQEKVDYFVPKALDHSGLETYYKYVDQIMAYVEENLPKAQDPSERRKIIGVFATFVLFYRQ